MRVFTILAVVLLSAVSGYAADVSGNWAMTLEAPQGSAEAALTLKQDGDKVSGTYKGPRNEAPTQGTLTGNDLSLSVSINAGGQAVTLSITAKVTGDTMEGTLGVGPAASVPFKATRKN
jgi:hypothetical protein